MANNSCDSFLDTTELRWFFDGAIPERVAAWFNAPTEVALTEERSDDYHVSDRVDTGLKRRHGQTLELKRRQGPPVEIEPSSGVSGLVERWRRWSPVDHIVDVALDGPWISVHKSAVKRRFSEHGVEAPLHSTNRSTYIVGCDVEIASLSCADTIAWTFAFSAYGANVDHVDILRAAAATVGLDHVDAPTQRLEAAICCGYPEWLATTAEVVS